jgi:hypothetical protein
LVRSGTHAAVDGPKPSLQSRIDQQMAASHGTRAQTRTVLSPDSGEAQRITRALMGRKGARPLPAHPSTTRENLCRHSPTWSR